MSRSSISTVTEAMKQWKISRVTILLVVVSVLGLATVVTPAAQRNWAAVTINQGWFRLATPMFRSDLLQDGVPDGWNPSNWGQARARIERDPVVSRSGIASAHLVRHMDQDASVLSQAFVTPAAGTVTCTVYHRGGAGFMQVRGDGISGESDRSLSSVSGWTAAQLRFTVFRPAARVSFTIGIAGPPSEIWFDDASCVIDDATRDLIVNGGFEDDGIQEDPIEWWAQRQSAANVDQPTLLAARDIVQHLAPNSSASMSRVAMVTLLTDPLILSAAPATLCSDGNDSLAPILGLESYMQAVGGLAARERLLQLAITLQPECPLAYAHLAKLYQEAFAFGRAADLYAAAARRSRTTVERGSNAFAEGMIEVTSIGDWPRAISALSLAEQNTGWEQSSWYQGAASLYLGHALRQAGRCADAVQAYQRVLACQICSARYEEARIEIRLLDRCQE